MENIAERAQTSIGSVYQFFPNKRAVFDVMAERYLDRAREVFEEVAAELGAADKAPWDQVLDAFIDGFSEFHRSTVMIRAVWVNWLQVPEFILVGEALNREFARRGVELLTERAKKLPAERRLLVATMIVEHISGIMVVALRRDDDLGLALMDETKVLLRRYLEPYLGAPEGSTKGKTPSSAKKKGS